MFEIYKKISFQNMKNTTFLPVLSIKSNQFMQFKYERVS